MHPADDRPWFHAALRLLDLRSNDRVLVIGGDAEEVRAIAGSVGRRGSVTAACPDAEQAEAMAIGAPQHVEVLAHAVAGGERYGTFDALFVTAPWGPLLGNERYAALAKHNLRPGGRCVIDLPGLDMVPELGAALADAGWPRERLAPLRGVGDDLLADSLRDAGLRSVRGVLGSHLIRPQSPAELVERFAAPLGLSLSECTDLARTLVQRAATTGAFDVLVHRTRVQALR